jgi:cyclopropane fatty-acyl-phospholipid synthase-like methyltransferase
LLDVGLFHNILPEKRKEYSKRVSDLLENNGKMLVFCFDKREKTFNNKDYYLNTLINITSYPLSKIEIINTFKENFIIQKIKPIRYGTKNYKRRFLCYLEKKD